MEQVLAIAQAYGAVSAPAFAPVLAALRWRHVASGEALWHMGQAPVLECFVLRGLVHTVAVDAQGHEVTLGFYVAPCVVSPAITRTAQGVARVSCIALEDARVAVFAPEVLNEAMVNNEEVRAWGQVVLQQELVQKAEREWMLAVQTGAQRLQHLRQAMPGLEARVAHRHVASYLGLTPVSLSRLRRQLRA